MSGFDPTALVLSGFTCLVTLVLVLAAMALVKVEASDRGDGTRFPSGRQKGQDR